MRFILSQKFAKNNPGLLVWGASNEELTMMLDSKVGAKNGLRTRTPSRVFCGFQNNRSIVRIVQTVTPTRTTPFTLEQLAHYLDAYHARLAPLETTNTYVDDTDSSGGSARGGGYGLFITSGTQLIMSTPLVSPVTPNQGVRETGRSC